MEAGGIRYSLAQRAFTFLFIKFEHTYLKILHIYLLSAKEVASFVIRFRKSSVQLPKSQSNDKKLGTMIIRQDICSQIV